MSESVFSDPEWLVTAFAATNMLRALFFLPQIAAVARSVTGARDIALSTWWMWVANNALGALYTGVVVHHLALSLSFWASTAACLVTIGLTLRARRRWARAEAMATSSAASGRAVHIATQPAVDCGRGE